MSITITTIGREALQGKRIELERVSPCHAEFLAQTYKLDEFMDCYRLAQDRNETIEQIRQRLDDEKSYSPQQLKRIEWIIKLRSKQTGGEDKPVGIAALADYQPTHRRAELLIGINRSEDRISGLGMEATLLVLEFAFQQAKLHKLTSLVYSFNKIAQKNTLHLGFQQEAILREHYFNHREGKFIDLYQNALLQKEFFADKKLSRWSKRLLNRDITLKKIQPKIETLSQDQMKEGLEKLMKQTKNRSNSVE